MGPRAGTHDPAGGRGASRASDRSGTDASRSRTDDGAGAHDLIVIGAGINGAAIAREASLHGNRVLVLERDDIGGGTSAASTRLIHGGLRYLEHAEIHLVRESLAERERLLATAPHLVAPLELCLPLYARSRRRPWQIRIGMWLYDLLSFDKSLPSHRMLDRTELLAALPALAPEGLVAGAVYFDAQVTYPERLVLENLLDAAAHGTIVETRAAATGIVVEQGRVVGVTWQRDGRSRFARAAVVVNATGPWVDTLLGGLRGGPLIGGTKGSHLVARPFPGAPGTAVYAEAASDGRPFFVIPWNSLYLIGTTDQRFDGDPGAVAISRAEVDYLLAETARLFPGAADLRGHLCYTQSGVRPLPPSDVERPGAITRRHMIHGHRDAAGLYSVIGGKLTTHRALAEDALKKIGAPLLRRGASPTRTRPLPGALAAADRDALLAELGASLGAGQAARLWRVYGGRAAAVAARIGESPALAEPLAPGHAMLTGELLFALEQEWATSLVDLLQRRTMCGLDADFGRETAPAAAERLVRLGIWDPERAAGELAAYRDYAHRFGVPDGRAD